MAVFNVQMEQKNVIAMIFVVHVGLGLPYLLDFTNRYGIDYVAYIQQAGAVYNGETDYSKLSSHLGPCYYPAGHLFHYMPAYWLHMQTEYAELIIKFGT